MSKPKWASALLCSLVALSPATSWAAPIDDLRESNSLWVVHVNGTLRGDVHDEGGFSIAKTPGSYTFHIERAAFGLGDGPPLDIAVSPLDDRSVVLDIDQNLVPSFRSGRVEIAHVRGHATARLEVVPGTATPSCTGSTCGFSVRMTLDPGAVAHVDGTYHTPPYLPNQSISEDISDIEATGFSGLPRPQIESFEISAPAEMCPGTWKTRTFFGHARLAYPAPATGAWVDFTSSKPSVVAGSRTYLPPGARDAYVSYPFQSGEEGIFLVTAASGGASLTRGMWVDPCVKLLGKVDRYTPRRDLIDPICESCIYDAKLTDRGPILVHTPDGWLKETAPGVIEPLNGMVGGQVFDANINELGEIFGTFEQNQQYMSFRSRGVAGAESIEFLPAWSVNQLTPLGAAVGIDWSSGQQPMLVSRSGQWLQAIQTPETFYSMTGMTSSGLPLFTSYGADGSRLWRARADWFEPLQVPGQYPYAIATNHAGEVLVQTYDAQWNQLVWVLADDGQLRQVARPQWAQWMSPVGLNDEGTVLANVYDGNWVAHPVLLMADGRELLLEQVTDPVDGILTDAVQMTPGGRILAHVSRQANGQNQQNNPNDPWANSTTSVVILDPMGEHAGEVEAIVSHINEGLAGSQPEAQ